MGDSIIDGNTSIKFKIGTVITTVASTVVSLVIILIAFYQIGFLPRIDAIDHRVESMSNEQTLIYKEINQIKISINELNVEHKYDSLLRLKRQSGLIPFKKDTTLAYNNDFILSYKQLSVNPFR
jgi:hypothetical protein